MNNPQVPPSTPAAESSRDAVTQKRHAFSFTGSAFEYFSIWIVNVALTVITFGLYSPWAKVRRERYLASHTWLAGTQFEYTADPWRIFKGRVLVLGVVVLVAAIRAVPGLWVLVLFPLIVLVWPWILASALRFRARYTSYRNLSFHFLGSPVGALTQCVLPKGAAIVTFWLLAPWAQCLARRYAVNNLQYGVTSFKTPVQAGQMYGAYGVGACFVLSGAAIALLGLGVLGVDAAMLQRTRSPLEVSLPIRALAVLVASCSVGLFAAARSYVRLAIAKSVWNGASVGSYTVSWNPSMIRYVFIEITNIALRALSLGLASPWCVVRVRRFLVDELALVGPQNMDEFIGERREEVRSLGEQAAEVYDLDLDFGF